MRNTDINVHVTNMNDDVFLLRKKQQNLKNSTITKIAGYYDNYVPHY